jgi:hypothetical protein
LKLSAHCCHPGFQASIPPALHPFITNIHFVISKHLFLLLKKQFGGRALQKKQPVLQILFLRIFQKPALF